MLEKVFVEFCASKLIIVINFDDSNNLIMLSVCSLYENFESFQSLALSFNDVNFHSFNVVIDKCNVVAFFFEVVHCNEH